MTNSAANMEARSDAAARRAGQRRLFLDQSGWGAAIALPMAGDASTRSYERLSLGGRTAVLMNAPPAAESAACPPDASPDARRALGYNAMARLAGPNLNAFTAVASALRNAGLSAPDLYAADAVSGFAIIEDLGDDLFARAIPNGADEADLYGAAIDALLALHLAAPPAPHAPNYRMLTYDLTAMAAEVSLVTDWYWPHLKGEPASDALKADYQGAWAGVLAKLPAPSMLVLRDFHAENLLWLPDRHAHARAGVIDFQDGLIGNPAYDLVSLLEDARRDVSPDLSFAMMRRYADGARDFAHFDESVWRRDYAILGAQRNAKILGIFARLIRRDGKPRYADFFPRVEGHFRGDLQHPELSGLAHFFRQHFPERFA